MMRRVVGWVGGLWLLAAGCTAPELEDLAAQKSFSCNAEHLCAEGYLCIQGACMLCQQSEIVEGYRDSDGDGYAAVDAASETFCRGMGGGYALQRGDCDDSNSARTPGKLEVCDEVDNDCDTLVDEGLTTSLYYRDADSDGFGVTSDALQKCRAPAGYVAATAVFDCNDTDPAIRPGAIEVCNDADDNCAGGVDEGLDKRWYRDADGDGFGLESEMLLSCTKPIGYVARTGGFDCDDADPRESPATPELCNGQDDNCDGRTDEVFTEKGEACSNGTCEGIYVCNASQTATECNSPAPVQYFSDVDGDGEGSTNAADMIQICPPNPPPLGYLSTSTDCDDHDSHNSSRGTEVCDDRDNNCANGKSDEAGVCGGKTWRQLTESVAMAHAWNTVAVGPTGYPVWIAGELGHLAVRTSAASNFMDLNQKCGVSRWNVAWVRPSDGQVFLGGDAGGLAAYNGVSPTCTLANTANATGGQTSSSPILGLVGFESGNVTTIYAVNEQGHIYSWNPGNNPVFKAKRSSADPLRTIHGRTSAGLFPAGGGPGVVPVIHRYDASSSGGLVPQTIERLPASNQGEIQGVWVPDDAMAYAVGKAGLLLRWNGIDAWSFTSPDPGMRLDLTSVVAFDDSSVYITDAAGNIRRPRAVDWMVHFTVSGGVGLKDIAASSRQDIWAVGPGVVVHFPER